MAETEALKNMVLSFRVSELQMLLGFAGRNKSGRKTELQARAVELLRLRSAPVQMKIKDLYKSIQQSHASGMIMQQQQQQQQPQQPQQQPPASSSSSATSRELQSVHSSTMPQHTAQQQQQQTPPQQPSAVYAQGGYASQTNAPPRRMYPSNMYYQPKASPPTTTSSTYPVHPDVRLKRLPFFEHVSELLKPSSLVPQGNQRLQECPFMFHLTPQQATDVASSRDLRPGSKMEFLIQVQMRFCLLETSCEQEDFFPPGICVKVNGKMCPLPNPIPTNKPGVEPKRPPRPVNITPMVKLSPTVANHINVSWNADYGRGYVITVNLVRKLTSSDLLQRLKNRGARHADFTRGLIKEKLAEDADCEIATTSLRVSLVCPLGKMRMTTPCRASTCYHLQCFDASVFLQMNERKPTWMCPVCDKPALYDNLVLDSYFQQVLTSGKLPPDGNEIQLHQDGSWSSLSIKKEQTRVVSPMQQDKAVVKIETVSDDLEVIATSEKEKEKEKEKGKDTKKNATVIDLTLSDSDDDVEADKNKSSAHNKPDSSNQSVGNTRHMSETSVSSGDGATQSNMGPSSVSSSGYMSPSIITLDSPSPPGTPAGSPPMSQQAVSAPPPQPSPVPAAQPSPQPQAAPPPPPPAPQQTALPGHSPGMRMCPPVFSNSMYLGPMPYLELDSDSNNTQSAAAAAAAAANASSMFQRY